MNLILTEPERITLQQLSLNHPHRDIRTKGYGLLLLARRFTPQQIADEIGCSWRVTYDWFHAWEQSGIVGLIGGHQGGRYPAMSPEMTATAVEIACSESLSLARIAQLHRNRKLIYLPSLIHLLTLADEAFYHNAAFYRILFLPDSCSLIALDINLAKNIYLMNNITISNITDYEIPCNRFEKHIYFL
ncbi:TPA: transposase [Salmonella enterica subsp. diarizonae serovar 61:r:z53]